MEGCTMGQILHGSARTTAAVRGLSVILCGARPYRWKRRDHRHGDRQGSFGSVAGRSEEHTSELQSLMRNSYAVSYLQNKKHPTLIRNNNTTYYLQKQNK